MTPSYSNLITQIVKRLQEDSRLSSVKDSNIFAGANPVRIVDWPAITVSLEQVEENWRTFGGATGGQKDAICTVRLSVLERVAHGSKGYTDGLSSVEGIVRIIDNIVQSDVGISGVSYKSETSLKTFALGTYDNVPVIGAEVELTTAINFTPA